jgi:hypothetical protein
VVPSSCSDAIKDMRSLKLLDRIVCLAQVADATGLTVAIRNDPQGSSNRSRKMTDPIGIALAGVVPAGARAGAEPSIAFLHTTRRGR